jgi:hypothetical protein
MAKDLIPDSAKVSLNKRPGGRKKEKQEIFIESFGVKIRITATKREAPDKILETLDGALGGCFEIIEKGETEFVFHYNWNENGKDSLYKGAERIATKIPRRDVLEQLESRVRITIAEYAVGKVFIHAGVVGWKDSALIVPANSFQGKTTLVAELVKRGAAYYSDEYAILDEDGFVHPFPKMLSVRGLVDEYRQVEIPVEEFGFAGTKKIPVGMFLLTEFKENARWKPKVLSAGQGIMEILPHTVPVRYNPEFTLKVLKRAANRAIIVKSFRGEAAKFAEAILNYFETKVLFD